MSYDPLRRQALFTLADARGNNPHGTIETADHEGRRRNAQRYETVEQIDARLNGGGTQGVPQPMGSFQPAPRASAGDLLGVAIGLGLLGAAAFLLLATKKGSETIDVDAEPAAPSPAPALPAPSVVVLPALPAPNPAPIIDVKATPVRQPRTRRRRRTKVEAATVNVTVTPPTT